MRTLVTAAAMAALVSFGVPQTARAQTFLTPYVGATFEGDAPASKLTAGLSVTFLGDLAGVELDVGYTPDFFNESNDVALVASSNITTAMVNVVISPEIGDGRVRPYVLFGGGLLRTRVDDDDILDRVSTNDTGVTIGVGVMALLSERAGIRGDLRYLRSLQDPPDANVDLALGKFDFWRGTVGLLIRF